MVVDVSGSGRRVLHFSPPSPQVLVDGQGNGDCSHCSGPVISAQATFCLPSMSSANISFQVVQQPRPHSTSRSDLDSSTANITTPSSCFGESKSSCVRYARKAFVGCVVFLFCCCAFPVWCQQPLPSQSLPRLRRYVCKWGVAFSVF